MIQSPTIAFNFFSLNYVFLFVPATQHSCVANFPIEIYTFFLFTCLLTYLLAYLLSYSTEQSPTGEAYRFSASQETARILRNPKVHYSFTSANHLSTS